ncbi:MAG TPA: FAD-dependent oxidoreductase [Gemmataceae bacterium]|jgi:flavin-dependent dehydrogenase
MTLPATQPWKDLGDRIWDAAIVGAGPAGAVAARELARRGLTVLLVDKSTFPRWKVCGCCLNGAALATLQSVGLGDLGRRLHAVPLTQTRIAARGAEATVAFPEGIALSRSALDAALIGAAVDAGASFQPGTLAQISCEPQETRTIHLCQPHLETRIMARVVLAADGLAGRALTAESNLKAHTPKASRIGAGAVADDAPAFYLPGTIFLACGPGGYLGLVRLEDDRLDLAAALDPAHTRAGGGPGAVAEAILRDVGWPRIPSLPKIAWRGTPPLTCTPMRLAEKRLFLLGDAAGYVEPFTGEGMAWAMASAVAVAPIAAEAARCWTPALIGEWTRRYGQCVGQRQRICRWLARGLRHPLLIRVVLNSLTRWPGLATPLLHRLNAPSSSLEGIAS